MLTPPSGKSDSNVLCMCNGESRPFLDMKKHCEEKHQNDLGIAT